MKNLFSPSESVIALAVAIAVGLVLGYALHFAVAP